MFDVIEYTRLEGNDCSHDIDALKSPPCGPYKQYENCDTWCQDRRNCAGYTVLDDVCYFKGPFTLTSTFAFAFASNCNIVSMGCCVKRKEWV